MAPLCGAVCGSVRKHAAALRAVDSRGFWLYGYESVHTVAQSRVRGTFSTLELPSESGMSHDVAGQVSAGVHEHKRLRAM